MIEAIRGAIAEAVRERRNPLASFVSLMRSLLLKALWKIVPRLPVPVQDRERFVSESMASAFETRIGGKTLSRRLWIAADDLMQNLGRTLAEGVRSGEKISKLVAEMQAAIEKAAGVAGKVEFDVSKDWLARLNKTSRGLIADPAGRATWNRAIAKARKLADKIRDAKSKRKALASLRKIEEAVKAANQELLDAAINEHLVNKQARYLARIARTERQIANIRAVGDAMAGDRNVIGFQWKLNALHPEPDICCKAGTLIATATGLKAIEQIELGDFVLTHRNRFKQVTRKYRRLLDETDILVRLEIQTESGESHQVTLTPNHPVATAKGWVPAGDLEIGCHVFFSEYAVCRDFHRLEHDAFCKEPSSFRENWIVRAIGKAFSELCDEPQAWKLPRKFHTLRLCFSSPMPSHKIDCHTYLPLSRLLSSLGFQHQPLILIDECENQQNGETSQDDACRNLDYLHHPLLVCTRPSSICFLSNVAQQSFFRIFGRLNWLLHGLSNNMHLSSISLDRFVSFQNLCRKFRISHQPASVSPLSYKRENNRPALMLLNGIRTYIAGKFSASSSPVKPVNSYINYSVLSTKATVKTMGETVYNLEVEDDQSYVAGGLVVHNCDRLASVEFGLGKGVFPKKLYPRSVGHPNCLCTIIPVTRKNPIAGTVSPESIKSQLPAGFYGSA